MNYAKIKEFYIEFLMFVKKLNNKNLENFLTKFKFRKILS